jgi:hypothetical protein
MTICRTAASMGPMRYGNFILYNDDIFWRLLLQVLQKSGKIGVESASNTLDEMARSRESPESSGAVIEIN